MQPQHAEGQEKAADILVSHPSAGVLPRETTAWRQSVAEPETIFTRERQSQLCFS